MRVIVVICLIFGLIKCSPVPISDNETLNATQKKESALTDEKLKEQGVELMKKFDDIGVRISNFRDIVVRPNDFEHFDAVNISMICVVLNHIVENIKEVYRNNRLYRDAVEISLNETVSEKCHDPTGFAISTYGPIGRFGIPLSKISLEITKKSIEKSLEILLNQAKGVELRSYFEDNLAVIRATNITEIIEKEIKDARDKAHVILNEQHESVKKVIDIYWNQKEQTDEGKKIIDALTPKRKELVDQLRTFEIKRRSQFNKKIKEKIEQQMREALEKKNIPSDLVKFTLYPVVEESAE